AAAHADGVDELTLTRPRVRWRQANAHSPACATQRKRRSAPAQSLSCGTVAGVRRERPLPSPIRTPAPRERTARGGWPRSTARRELRPKRPPARETPARKTGDGGSRYPAASP